jgi:hypothetical protein
MKRDGVSEGISDARLRYRTERGSAGPPYREVVLMTSWPRSFYTQNEPGGFITRGGLEPNPLKLNIP